MTALRLPLLSAVLFLVGCSASLPAVRGHHDTLRERIHRAKSLGGIECAPADLASAQAHFRFATLELSQGDPNRAEWHVEVGLDHADAAIAAGTACPAEGARPKDLLADPWPDADGDEVPTVDDECPYAIEDRDGFEDLDGCPEPDNDQDGVLDAQDQCPMDAEDIDGFKDADGCPEFDNDEDGVPDDSDYCPQAAETMNGFEDDDGCPDFKPEHVDVLADRIAFKKPLVFLDKMPVLLGLSHPALREVAMLLKAEPEIRIAIGGHTDNRGEVDALQKLSEGRAKSVFDFLVQQGVEEERMQHAGYGDAQPISTNRTASGRKLNQRVEILIVTAEPTPEPTGDPI
ncbi:MAG: OmpA family protein [Proteobacteria bacterium]|nr:OmpA family protein [Pseudomonadota bacterium]